MSVTLRTRRLANGREQIFLDLYRGHGNRTQKSLGLLPKDREERRRFIAVCKKVRAKWEIQLLKEEHGLAD